MKSKKNLLSALLGVLSVLTCLSGALILKKNVVVNADVSTQVGQVTGDRNVYLADGASDAVVPLSLGESVASEVAINGVVQNIDIEKGTNNLTLKGISTHLNTAKTWWKSRIRQAIRSNLLCIKTYRKVKLLTTILT